MPDDAEYLCSYAESRDEEAFSAFVRQNVDFVYSAAFRQTSGDVHLAEDITQGVFAAAAQKAAALARHPLVRAWLYQATRYAAIDALRSRRRRRAREEAASQMNETFSESSAPEAPLDWNRISPELDQFVASLGTRDRDAVILRFFGGKSFVDIGAQLQVSESAARMRVERALGKLRIRLARRGIRSSCAALGALVVEKGSMAAPAGLGPASIAAGLGAPALSGTAAVLTFFKLMTAAKIIATGATIVALVSIVTAVHEHQLAQTAEQALTEATRVQVAAQKAIPKTTGSSVQASRTQPEPVVQKDPSVATPKEALRRDNAFGALLGLLSNPAMQQQTSLLAKSRLDAQYGGLFKELALAPDQLERFKTLLVEKQMVGFDSMAAAHDQGIDSTTDPKAFFQAIATAEKTVDSEIASLLGTDGYGEFQKYQETVPARNTVNLLQQSLSYTAAPLTDDQAKGVTQLLSQYGKSLLPPNNPLAVLNSDLGVMTLNEQGTAQIQSLLSPPQFQTLKEKMQQQQQILQARQRMGRP